MKKVIFSMLFLIFSVSFAFPQDYAVDKGAIVISGMASFSSWGGDLYEGSDSSRATIITLAPNIDYFVVKNIFIGGRILFESMSQGDYSLTTFGIGPQFGYAFGQKNSNIFPYLIAGVYYNTSTASNGTDITFSGFDFKFGGGLMFTVAKHIGINIGASYNLVNRKSDDAGAESESGDIIGLDVGISGLIF